METNLLTGGRIGAVQLGRAPKHGITGTRHVHAAYAAGDQHGARGG
ncbi:hypothetical protein [Streptomyces sp. MBT53]|nr:hypothetical protein [Streptomyces sp. MBT53]